MAHVLKSGCFCGAVQVELTGQPNVQAYCHCSSCRGWLGAPIHAATLWPTPNVKVVKGADKLGTFRKTEASHRQFCTSCGSPVLVLHPTIGMTDVPVAPAARLVTGLEAIVGQLYLAVVIATLVGRAAARRE